MNYSNTPIEVLYQELSNCEEQMRVIKNEIVARETVLKENIIDQLIDAINEASSYGFDLTIRDIRSGNQIILKADDDLMPRILLTHS